MLGLKRGTVRLVPHNERWHDLFAEEEDRLRVAISEYALAIEHVGSTAICGLSAKPIIDIAVAVRKIADAGKCVIPLEGIGYEYRGEQSIPGRHFFGKGEPRTHHLHMVEMSSDFWRSHLVERILTVVTSLRQQSRDVLDYLTAVCASISQETGSICLTPDSS
jgi:GrpB-like predicted nucleotidyltransferase (UPF0157 family)